MQDQTDMLTLCRGFKTKTKKHVHWLLFLLHLCVRTPWQVLSLLLLPGSLYCWNLDCVCVCMVISVCVCIFEERKITSMKEGWEQKKASEGDNSCACGMQD